MTDLEMLRRAMLLDPWDDLARLAYCDEHEARAGWRPSPLTEWKGTLEEFFGGLGVLFERSPVREVTLADKHPLDNERVEGYFGGDPHSPATEWFWIPQAAESAILWEVPAEFGMGWANAYSSEEAALDALSLHAVNYGRSLAGLPPLPPRA